MGVIRRLLFSPPNLRDLPILAYRLDFSLSRLLVGVDNIHYDVHLSPRFRRAAERAAFCLMMRHTGTEELLKPQAPGSWKPIQKSFQERCRGLMTASVHRAKSMQEVQIDYLGQVAVVKFLKKATEAQYESVLGGLEKLLRTQELSLQQDLAACVAIKEKLSWIRQHRSELMRRCTAGLLEAVAQASEEIGSLREANFGPRTQLPQDLFSHPMLHAPGEDDDELLLRNYVLLSHRFEDPDSYERLLTLLNEFLQQTDLASAASASEEDNLPEPSEGLSRLWMRPENVDILFDDSTTESQIKRAGRESADRQERRLLLRRRRTQRRMLRSVYHSFRRAKLLPRIAAGFELEPLVAEFCPPLSPQQVLRYLIDSASRKRTAAQLSRLKGFYGRPFSVSSLNKTIRHIRNLPKARMRERLLRFLRALSRYHRDLHHHRLMRAAMDAVNLETDDRTLQLSRENRTLYEFLLPDEQIKKEQPVVSHVIVKADVRGSTDLTYRMRSQQLNPASFFSLNLYDPISEVLFEYDATKEFIEGDALILSIFEQQDTPEGWYSVGRACGLAIRILQIVAQSNIKSRKHRLPSLEMGIGICFNEMNPAFLFDGANRIMISPAINRADRLSGCDKTLRRLIEKQNLPFHLYVFQTVSETEKFKTADDVFWRYNVNGIELNPGGFRKLTKEINLLPIRFADGNQMSNAAHRFFAGKIPLIGGKYQTLVVREAPVFRVAPDSLKITGKTPHYYYELCTHPRLYEKAEQVLAAEEGR